MVSVKGSLGGRFVYVTITELNGYSLYNQSPAGNTFRKI
jgi:hypothetical protein